MAGGHDKDHRSPSVGLPRWTVLPGCSVSPAHGGRAAPRFSSLQELPEHSLPPPTLSTHLNSVAHTFIPIVNLLGSRPGHWLSLRPLSKHRTSLSLNPHSRLGTQAPVSPQCRARLPQSVRALTPASFNPNCRPCRLPWSCQRAVVSFQAAAACTGVLSPRHRGAFPELISLYGNVFTLTRGSS